MCCYVCVARGGWQLWTGGCVSLRPHYQFHWRTLFDAQTQYGLWPAFGTALAIDAWTSCNWHLDQVHAWPNRWKWCVGILQWYLYIRIKGHWRYIYSGFVFIQVMQNEVEEPIADTVAVPVGNIYALQTKSHSVPCCSCIVHEPLLSFEDTSKSWNSMPIQCAFEYVHCVWIWIRFALVLSTWH